MPSLNLYISDDLKARMAVHDLNWSQIAAAAINTAIDIHERTTMSPEEGTIARLRAQRDAATEKRRAEGVGLGIAYASAEDADYEELAAIAELREDEFYDAYAACEAVINCIGEGQSGWDLADFNEYCLRREGNRTPPLVLVEGFIEGVGKIADQV